MANSAWVDLTQRLHSGTARMPFLPAPQFRHVLELSERTPQVTVVDLCCHVGTHVDAPCHFVAGGRSIDQIPLDRFLLAGLVWPVQPAPSGEVGLEALRPAGARLRPGEALILDTGWGERADDPSYMDHPFLSAEAARWCVEAGISLVGCDFLTPDMPARLRPPDFNYPAHRTLLGNDVLIVENLSGLRPLSGRRVELQLAPVPLVGADGAPLRALGRIAE